MRILGVGANPDDLEILCAGTLAKYAQDGHQIIMCVVTNGDKGHFKIPSSELAIIRKNEAKESGKVISAEVICLDYPDGEVYSGDREVKLKFIDIIRKAKPDLIITHHPDDYFVDHREVSKLIYDCSFLSSVPYIETEHEHHTRVTPIYYMDTLAGINFSPIIYVDISSSFNVKKEMLSKHQSQVKWLKERDNVDILEFIEVIAKFRGFQCGVEYAEGFVACQAWLHNKPMELFTKNFGK